MPTRSQEHLTRVGRVTSGGQQPTIGDPKIVQLIPNTAAVGTGSLLVRVLGTGFTPSCFVEVNHVPVPTGALSNVELTATLNRANYPAGQLEFTVRNNDNNEESNSVMFTVT